jgi:hypothetical protein
MRKALDKAGWSVDDVDLFEVNEAFAVVAMIAAKELDIPAEKLNVNGGATALGHPIGASGARIMATLIAALENRGLKRGVASLCIGGGEATAVALELAYKTRKGTLMDIKGIAAIVTGGASGLGNATAKMLAARMALRLTIFDMNAEAGEAAAAEIGGICSARPTWRR